MTSEILQGFLITIILVLLTVNFVAVPSGPLRSGSMRPTLEYGDNVLIEKISWKLGLRPLQPGALGCHELSREDALKSRSLKVLIECKKSANLVGLHHS
jgi:hypothetical protein